MSVNTYTIQSLISVLVLSFRLLWNPKIHYRVHDGPPLAPVLNHVSPTLKLKPVYLRPLLKLFVCLRGVFLGSPTKILHEFFFCPMRSTSPAHPILHYLLTCANYKLIVTRSAATSCQHLALELLSLQAAAWVRLEPSWLPWLHVVEKGRRNLQRLHLELRPKAGTGDRSWRHQHTPPRGRQAAARHFLTRTATESCYRQVQQLPWHSLNSERRYLTRDSTPATYELGHF
jgi:hypothetical protein